MTYLHPDLEPVLSRTLGVPLFQEQGMKVAVVMAGFSPGQADKLRKLMGFKRAHDLVQSSLKDLWDGMMTRGVSEEVALRIVHQLEGFASYGFPESHAASFALLTYASAYLRHHFHPEYLAAMLNAQPMGFYAPATLVADARRHGVEVRPVDLVFSAWDCTLEARPEGAPALRLGLRYVKGLSQASREALQAAMAAGPLSSLDELVRRSDAAKVPDHVLITLARAGAFRTLWPGRREALWEVLKRLRERGMSLKLTTPERAPTSLPSMSALEDTRADYATLGLSHRHHPMRFHRDALRLRGVLGSAELSKVPHGHSVTVAGLVTCRQRPGSAKGVLFLTLEDEHGMVNVVVMPDVFLAQRMTIVMNAALEVRGTLERQHGVINILGTGFLPLSRVGVSIPQKNFR